MDWFVKHWDELTRDELYDLLAVRTAVFVVEQRCPYQEADGLDRRAWHVFARDGGGAIQACLRILEPENGTAQIGRVLTVNRGTGLGRALMERGIRAVWEKTDARRIRLEAQSYAASAWRPSPTPRAFMRSWASAVRRPRSFWRTAFPMWKWCWSGSSKKRRPRPPLFIFSSWHTAACRDWRC